MKTAQNESTQIENTLQTLVTDQVNATLQKGSMVSAILALSSSLALFVMMKLQIVKEIDVPILWTILGGSYSLIVYILARTNRIQSRLVYFVMTGFVSIPSVIFILAQLMLPAGAATYINGPAGYLYFFLIIISGFAFNFRLSVLTGSMAAVQYIVVILFSLSEIQLLKHSDQLMQQDNSNPVFYFFRPMMMFVSGLIVGYIGKHVRSLVRDSINKEKEKTAINRLFGLYVSPEIRERVLSQSTDSTGEKKNLVILFCDIRGFTSFSESRPPETVVNELNDYFNEMAKAIAFESGTIDKFIGDAIMAVFGGAVELASPCDSALNAAIHMQRNLAKLNDRRSAAGLEKIKNGIGLHFGEVFIGSLGSSERKDFTVIGDAVNTASRIESLCKDHNREILFSEDFFFNLSDDLKGGCEPIGEFQLKGKVKKTRVYSLKQI